MPNLIKSTYHKDATDLGDDTFHANINSGAHVYYHTKDDTPREFSVIDSRNTQTLTSKFGGDVSHIHKFMETHIKNFGELNSSDTHSVGGKRLLVDFIKKNPRLRYSVHNKITGEHISNIDKDTDLNKLWATQDKTIEYNTYIKASNAE